MAEDSPDDRRRSPRVPLGVRVAGATTEDEKPLAIGYACDISLTGIYLELMLTSETVNDIAINRRVNLRFRPPNTDDPIEVVGLVRRIARDDAHQPIGIGIEFVEFERGARTAIEQYITARSTDEDYPETNDDPDPPLKESEPLE